ncbi:ABC transporter ATP-binding protein [Ignavibacteria bacterium]|nr:ABC transporter ATP-binding protein [Bacteroidota bacterium]MCZ2133123.1 ABC transporter ATP-binding protein/permease [Bacteroidota bacterium]
MKIIFRILGFIRGFGFIFFLSILCNTAYSVLSAASIAIIQPVLEVLFEVNSPGTAASSSASGLKEHFYRSVETLIMTDDKYGSLSNLCIFIVIIFTAKNIAKYLGGNANMRLGEGMIKKMRDVAFERIMRQSLPFFQRRSSGDLISLIANDVTVMNGSISPLLATIFREPIEIAVFLILLLSFSPFLTLIAFSSSIVGLILIRVSTGALRRYAVRMQNAMANFTSVLQESIYAARLIKTMSAEQTAVGRFRRQTHEYVRALIKNQKVYDAVPAVNEILAITALSCVLYIGGREVYAGAMKGEELMTFLFALFGIMSPISSVAKIPAQVQRGLVAAERVFEAIDTEPAVQDGKNEARKFLNVLEARNVSFTYGDREALSNASVIVPKSKKIAFVGPSGGGKSTMTDILIRLYDPSAGGIYIDGSNIREFTLESYHSLFGVVSQEAILFNDTIAANIGFGRGTPSREEITEAAKAAHAHEFIAAMPQGYDTIIGDRGTQLSGGQRQRISIARALINHPEILIFDEATSALDSESERLVQQAINNILENRTAIIVAHRLSTIRDADVIYVFDGGRVAEHGSHDTLMAAGGIYKRLFDIQFSTVRNDAAALQSGDNAL